MAAISSQHATSGAASSVANTLNQNQRELTAKILLIGDSGVGKTSVMSRFVDNEFPKSHISTIGVDFKIKRINVTTPDPSSSGKDINHSIKLQLWDTAGQERFKTLSDSYYRGTHGCVLIYDVTSKKSFQNIMASWYPKLKEQLENKSIYMILGNKHDLAEQSREVSENEGRDLALQLNALFYEVSAKLSNETINNNDNHDNRTTVKHAMIALCKQIVTILGDECSTQDHFSNRYVFPGRFPPNHGSSRENLIHGISGSSMYPQGMLNENNDTGRTCCGLYIPFSQQI